MAIRNPDGSMYEPSGSLEQYDPTNQEHDLFNLWDTEQIRLDGSPVEYYEVLIDINRIDELYVEARDKLFSPCSIKLYAYYDPQPSNHMQGLFGIDSPNDETLMEFNFRDVMDRTSNRGLKVGSRIWTPHKRENWVIVKPQVQVFKQWGQLRLQCMCVRFQESLTTMDGEVTKKEPASYKINSIRQLGKGPMNLAGGQPEA